MGTAATAIETAATDLLAACGSAFAAFTRPVPARADDFFRPDPDPPAEEDGERWDGLG